MKRIISLIIIAAIALTMCAVLAGCGKKATDATTPTAATKAATEAATQATEQTATQAAQNSNNSTQSNNSDNSSNNNSGSGTQVDSEGYIDEDTAIHNILQIAEAGSVLVSDYRGYSTDGAPAWIVVIQRPDGVQETYYSGYQFGYKADDSSEEVEDGHGIFDAYYANVSEQDAGFIALRNIGDGWHITSTYQSSYEGVDAWAIVVTNDETGQSRTAYVNGSDCYFG